VLFGKESWKPEADVVLDGSDKTWEQLSACLGTDALTPKVEDKHTAWFSLLGTLLSPNSPPHIAANAAYRLSWYMPSVDASRKAAAHAAMANMSDSEVLSVLRPGAYLWEQLDGTPAEHAGYMLSYDKNIVARLRTMLAEKKIPQDLEATASRMADFIAQFSER
jgi:hypothetical protein